MSEIHQSINAHVPFEDVPALAKRFLAGLPGTRQGETLVNLHATIGNVVVERGAAIKIVPAREYPGFEILDISWRAAGEGGIYPTAFNGTLSAEQEDIDFCRLDLDGGYVPPGGIIGRAFDAVLGHQIADEVARELLQTLKTTFEELDAEEERRP